MAIMWKAIPTGERGGATKSIIAAGDAESLLLAMLILVKATREFEHYEGSWQFTARRRDCVAIRHSLSKEMRFIEFLPTDKPVAEVWENILEA